MTRDDWIGWIQQFLEERLADAPDETCKILANDLWEMTAELDDDD
jgi:hypothetical protein